MSTVRGRDYAPIFSAKRRKEFPGGGQISGASSERYGFAQREHDGENGLVYMRHRMYDPRTGRFTQTDPIVGNRASKHYSYSRSNPLVLVDPWGLDDQKIAEAQIRFRRNVADIVKSSSVTQRMYDIWKSEGGDIFAGDFWTTKLDMKGKLAYLDIADESASINEFLNYLVR